MDELIKGLRLSLASLFEHEPSMSALFAAFGPYSSERQVPFVLTCMGTVKLEAAISKLGSLQALEMKAAQANSRDLETRYGTKAAVSFHWFLGEKLPLEGIVEAVIAKLTDEIHEYSTAPEDFQDLTVITTILKRKPPPRS